MAPPEIFPNSHLILTARTCIPYNPVHTTQCRQSQLCIDWVGMAMDLGWHGNGVLLNSDSLVTMTNTPQQRNTAIRVQIK